MGPNRSRIHTQQKSEPHTGAAASIGTAANDTAWKLEQSDRRSASHGDNSMGFGKRYRAGLTPAPNEIIWSAVSGGPAVRPHRALPPLRGSFKAPRIFRTVSAETLTLTTTSDFSLDSGMRSGVYNPNVANKNNHSDESLRPGELARLAGVSVDTLRHYERKGLLSPRRAANRYREYPVEAVDRVRLVRRALSIGFGLDDLARILKERDNGGAPCRHVRQLAQSKLAEIERLIEELGVVRDDLRRALEDWDIRLGRAEANQPVRLLEALAADELKVESCRMKVRGSGQPALRTVSFRSTQRKRRTK